MPSDNIVIVDCIDEEGSTVQVTDHPHALTFSFRARTIFSDAARIRSLR